MAEYIERDAALSIIEEMQRALCPVGRFGPSFVYGSDRETFFAWQEIFDSISAIHAADVAPVVHGRWIQVRWVFCDDPDGGYWIVRCDQCCIPQAKEYRFCPNCGAKMDKNVLRQIKGCEG